MSEPSGVGFVEFSGTSTFTGATQQQQHLQSSHDVQKPTSAAYPSNLDQEIGQSTLGQLHHELARLHEAGRFVKRPCGGWSQNGLGGLDEVDGARQQLPGEQGESGQQYSVDWESVLFHEKLSAQLGCLEALIIMAHYYLGLPTQLLSDCPIKVRRWRFCVLMLSVHAFWAVVELCLPQHRSGVDKWRSAHLFAWSPAACSLPHA